MLLDANSFLHFSFDRPWLSGLFLCVLVCSLKRFFQYSFGLTDMQHDIMQVCVPGCILFRI